MIYRPTFNPVPYLNPSLPTVYSLSIYRLVDSLLTDNLLIYRLTVYRLIIYWLMVYWPVVYRPIFYCLVIYRSSLWLIIYGLTSLLASGLPAGDLLINGLLT